jgi:hypothetical protein
MLKNLKLVKTAKFNGFSAVLDFRCLHSPLTNLFAVY